ncbi:hypothetical protein VZT92_008832 [Zoarces viviparus]|uniref:Uncharacterized protein n=1 Tax=Zoarces viviparus TaxID=48416 RepID=A0AAW1FGT0_ZOAVI
MLMGSRERIWQQGVGRRYSPPGVSVHLSMSVPAPPGSLPPTSLQPCIILNLLQITHQLQRPSTNCHHDAHRWQLPVVLPSDWWRDFQTENSW